MILFSARLDCLMRATLMLSDAVPDAGHVCFRPPALTFFARPSSLRSGRCIS
jgi:hypothetical protein